MQSKNPLPSGCGGQPWLGSGWKGAEELGVSTFAVCCFFGGGSEAATVPGTAGKCKNMDQNLRFPGNEVLTHLNLQTTLKNGKSSHKSWGYQFLSWNLEFCGIPKWQERHTEALHVLCRRRATPLACAAYSFETFPKPKPSRDKAIQWEQREARFWANLESPRVSMTLKKGV